MAGLFWGPAWAADYKLLDGSTISGEISDGNDYGVAFRLDIGGFSKRISYSKFTQEALKLLAENPKLKPMVEPFIELPPEFTKPKPKPTIRLRDVPRADRPPGRTTFFSSFTTPLGLVILGVLYLANLLAAYEIARYRNRPVALACGLSALLPVLGPIIFLVSPSLEPAEESEATAPEEALGGPAIPQASSPAGATSRKVGMPAPLAAGGLRMAAAAKTEERTEAKAYKRGDYTFNRRFFETQFSGFFRVVPTDADKDMVLVVTTAKAEYVGKRISRISAADFFLQLLMPAGKEVGISFAEVAQIAVKHKDEIRTR
jgi:hypothetical protein